VCPSSHKEQSSVGTEQFCCVVWSAQQRAKVTGSLGSDVIKRGEVARPLRGRRSENNGPYFTVHCQRTSNVWRQGSAPRQHKCWKRWAIRRLWRWLGADGVAEKKGLRSRTTNIDCYQLTMYPNSMSEMCAWTTDHRAQNKCDSNVNLQQMNWRTLFYKVNTWYSTKSHTMIRHEVSWADEKQEKHAVAYLAKLKNKAEHMRVCRSVCT